MKIIFQLKLKSVNKSSLILYKLFLKNIFKKLNITFNSINFPKTKKRFTLLKSPHVHKSSREQFEIITHSTIINILSAINTNNLNLLLLNKPKTVKITLRKIV